MKNNKYYIIIIVILVGLLVYKEVKPDPIKQNNIDFYNNIELFNVEKYIKCIGASSPPQDGSLGLWLGSGDLDNNQPNYFIVHNNNEIGEKLQNAKIGDTFTINKHTYKIYDVLYILNNYKYEDIKSLVMPKDTQIVSIQTCVFGTPYLKIVIAELINYD